MFHGPVTVVPFPPSTLVFGEVTKRGPKEVVHGIDRYKLARAGRIFFTKPKLYRLEYVVDVAVWPQNTVA